MGNEKLTENMSFTDIIVTMGEKNPGATSLLMQLMHMPNGMLYILLCDSLDIRGRNLYILYTHCCKGNIHKFIRSLLMLSCDIFSQEQIKSNFNLVDPISFIDDNIIIEGIPPYGEYFDQNHEKWIEFCEKNKESFLYKLDSIMDKQNKQKRRN